MRQSELVAQGQLAINAANRINIDVRDIDQQSVSQTIDAMVTAGPELAWLKQAEAQGDVDWRQVKEVHDSWDYHQSGLGEGAALAVSIAATAVMLGIGTGLAGAMMTAAAGSLAGTGAVSLVNNRGNLGATLGDTLSSDGLKSALIAAASAGISENLDSVWGGETDPATGRTIPHDLSTWGGTGRFAGQLSSQALADAELQSVINGGSLNDNLKQNLRGAVTTVLEASLFNLVGDLTKDGAKGSNGQFWTDGSAEKTVVHALAAGLASEATGGDFRTGAIAAGANEALINQLDGLVKGDKRLLIAASQITGIVAAGLTDGDVQKGAEIAGNATSYNHLRHEEVQALSDELDACKEKGNCSSEDVDKILAAYENLSAENASTIANCSNRSCVEDIRSQSIGFNDPAAKNIFNTVNGYFAYDVAGLLQGDPSRLVGEDQTFGNHQSNRGLFLPITDLTQSKILQESWLSESEKIKLKKWNENTSYLNKLAGHELSLGEKIKFAGDLTSFAAMIFAGGSSKNAIVAQQAKKLGYVQRVPPQKLPFDSHGQPAFFDGKNYITRDIDSHNVTDGWKIFSKKGVRKGNYDSQLERIKD